MIYKCSVCGKEFELEDMCETHERTHAAQYVRMHLRYDADDGTWTFESAVPSDEQEYAGREDRLFSQWSGYGLCFGRYMLNGQSVTRMWHVLIGDARRELTVRLEALDRLERSIPEKEEA